MQLTDKSVSAKSQELQDMSQKLETLYSHMWRLARLGGFLFASMVIWGILLSRAVTILVSNDGSQQQVF
jgi:hypothetical protein